MIVELSVENLAIIERCDLALGPGFTALTGETGAGKSLLIDALQLAFGGRADTTLVRTGASRALVSVTVDLSDRPDVALKCRELGAEPEDGALFLQREVFAEGRSQCRIGGRLAPVSTLRDVGRLLVDLHGQHDHQSLLDPKTHLGFLDAWIGEPALSALATVELSLEKWREGDKKLQVLRGGRRDREQRVDLLKFQVGEIESVSPREGELAELDSRLARLKHAEALARAVATVRQALVDGDATAQDAIGLSIRTLQDAEELDPALAKVREPLDHAAILLEEALAELRDYDEMGEDGPEQLEETAGRIDSLKRLLRKYGDDEAAVLEFLHFAKEELELLTSDEEGEEALLAEVTAAREALTDACGALSALRKGKAGEFAHTVESQMRDLAMEKARFEVGFSEKEPETDGADAVEFLFSANVGEPVKPLSRIASGGEISRVMLAVKTALSGKAGVPTLVFDEVDAGLGGKAAATVARKIEELAQHDQILVITHLPQIAGRATAHFHVQKSETNGRVSAGARSLTEPERIEEIARMLAGEEVGDSARQHARELLSKQY